MTTNPTCPQCGSPLEKADAPCPICLLRLASKNIGEETIPDFDIEVDFIQKKFPDLEIIEVIGRGGMGTVYKARQPKLDRFVALKILSENLAAKLVFAERFAREGKILAKLNHPNIVSVYDFGQVEVGSTTLFYLILEYVDGVNLRQAMREEKFTPEQAIAIVPKICEALQFAHDEGVLHRDIKPENILLDTKGRVKIADFGIASIRGAEHHETHLTGTGQILGTPDYMAPEQRDSPETVDNRADIYSLGVVFYELLTGELPRGSFPPPSANTPVSTEIDGVVLKALKKNREQRQQTAFELKTEIETVTITKKENETMTPHEEHLNSAAEIPRQPEPQFDSEPRTPVNNSGTFWKYLLWFVCGAVVVHAAGVWLMLADPDTSVNTMLRSFKMPFRIGGITLIAVVIGVIVLIIRSLTKNNRTVSPTVSPVYSTTDNRGSGGSVWKSLFWFLGGVIIILLGVFALGMGLRTIEVGLAGLHSSGNEYGIPILNGTFFRNPSINIFFGSFIVAFVIVGGTVAIVRLLGGRILKSLFWFFGGVIIVLLGVFALRVAADHPPILVFGTGIMITLIIVGGIVLIVYLIVKNVGTSVPNVPQADQSTLFCTHCGGRLTGNAYACPHCGFAPRSERNFCFHCGVATNPKQVMCVACGFPLQVPLSLQVSGLLKAKKDKVVAGILAILLGWLGIHKFYLGSWGWGILYFLFSWSVIPFIVSVIEGVIFLTMDEVAFDVKYNQTPSSPFRW